MEPTFEQMTPAERILYVQDLWDRIAADAAKVPLSPVQEAELDRRVEAYRKGPEESIPWQVARERMRRRDYPEGTVLEFEILEPEEELDPEELARLDAALERSRADIADGRTISAEELIRKLRSSR